MKRAAKAMCFALALAFSATLPAREDGIQVISQHEADMLLAVLQARATPLTLAGQIPPSPPGELDPILATSGVHCILPNSDELYYIIRYVVGTGQEARRTIFAFTLSPATSLEQGSTDIARLLNGKKVTQYEVWHASKPPGEEHPTDAVIMVDLVSRTPSMCALP